MAMSEFFNDSSIKVLIGNVKGSITREAIRYIVHKPAKEGSERRTAVMKMLYPPCEVFGNTEPLEYETLISLDEVFFIREPEGNEEAEYCTPGSTHEVLYPDGNESTTEPAHYAIQDCIFKVLIESTGYANVRSTKTWAYIGTKNLPFS